MLDIKLLEKLTSIPSPSGFTSNITKYIKEYLERLDYKPFLIKREIYLLK